MKLPILFSFAVLLLSVAHAQDRPLIDPTGELPEALTGAQMAQLVKSVDRGLIALRQMQERDGSFQGPDYAKTGLTSLVVMAYLSRGHKPGEGPYGSSLNKAINFVLSQQQESGLFSAEEIDYERINIEMAPFSYRIAAKSYNHAICMLMLGEVYGLTGDEKAFRIRNAIEKGLKFTIQLWDIRKGIDLEDGGFRYTQPWEHGGEGDMSVTGWHAASLRSIRNAGFDVPQSVMDRIARYVVRNQNSDGGFGYASTDDYSTITLTAAGTLCLALAGKHEDPETLKAARILSRFNADNRESFRSGGGRRWPYYACYYVTQASIQVGGQVWVTCMGETAEYLLRNQQSNGLWRPDGSAALYGQTYSTSMAIIALTPSLQLLPIYQR
ncbi:MAG: terpene cyclase/mutase family protein [Verrucomicrobiales bacterium]|nr:terpene cyclase/mutase family protein [Verrucomicrobiales bacterium]